jgi:hypothetical protein
MFEITADELPRFMACNGSLWIERDPSLAFTDQEARNEGIATHWLAKEIFDNRMSFENAVGVRSPIGVFITPEMIEHVKGYLEIIQPGAMEVVTSYRPSDGVQVNGRADHICYFNNVLYIDDYKNGWRIRNPDWTLISHAIGWMIANPSAQVDMVRISIYQPKPYHPDGKYRSIDMFPHELAAKRDELFAALAAPKQIVTSGEQCHHCPSATKCPANRMSGGNSIDLSYIAMSERLTDDALSYELDALTVAETRIKDRKAALEALATARIKAGSVVPHYALEQKLGNTRFKGHVTPALLKALVGPHVIDEKLPTPKQAKERGLHSVLYDNLTERPTIGTGLKRIDVQAKATKAFGEIATGK